MDEANKQRILDVVNAKKTTDEARKEAILKEAEAAKKLHDEAVKFFDDVVRPTLESIAADLGEQDVELSVGNPLTDPLGQDDTMAYLMAGDPSRRTGIGVYWQNGSRSVVIRPYRNVKPERTVLFSAKPTDLETAVTTILADELAKG